MYAGRRKLSQGSGDSAVRLASGHPPARKDKTMDATAWCGSCGAVLLSAVLAVPAQAQGTVKSVHGDWQVRCDTPPGAQGNNAP